MTFAAVNGLNATTVRMVVGSIGPWFADIEMEGDKPLSGRVTIDIGETSFVGTVDESQNGVFSGVRKLRVIGGGGGWSKQLTSKNYHNDAQIRARDVAQDAAREAGETLGSFIPASERIGVDYVRSSGPASRVVEDVVGSASWWVGYDGLTHVGTRTGGEVPSDAYEVLAYDPDERRATLGLVDASVVTIGSVISKNLDAPRTVRELEIIVTAEDMRVIAWCGGSGASQGHLADILRSIVDRYTGGKLHGTYRYRVVRMSGDRVECQAVRRGAGLPDILPVSMWPGVAGAHAELSPGAEVLVEFVEGDRTMPVVTHFAGKDGAGHVPVSLALCGSTQAAARQGDLVQSGGAGTTVTFSPIPPPVPPAPLVPAPLSTHTPYLISFSSAPTDIGPLAAPLYGAISTGSPKVRA